MDFSPWSDPSLASQFELGLVHAEIALRLAHAHVFDALQRQRLLVNALEHDLRYESHLL